MIKEYRKITPMALRNLCIQNEFYTYGDNEEYSHLLFELTSKETLTTADIVAIASDIWNHSDIEQLERVGIDIATICCAIAEKSHSIFIDDSEPSLIITHD